MDVESLRSQLELGWVLQFKEGKKGLSELDMVRWFCMLVVEH